MADNHMTEKAFPRLGAKDLAMGVLWILVISGAGILGSNFLFNVRAPAWEAGVVYLASILALFAMAIAAIVLTPLYVMTHIQKQSEHQNGK